MQSRRWMRMARSERGEGLFLRAHVVGGEGLVAGGLQCDEHGAKQRTLELDDALLDGVAQRVRRRPQLVWRHGERVQERMEIVRFAPELDPVSADPLFQLRPFAGRMYAIFPA